ncbi:hypothetical protein CDV36_016101 [Fusarium kuroshium]|uniref:Uncharacterized protein n=2 Tax=Fusarium solani species complex TaxID=232080 RepID=A0A3M2QZJ4_9HYPO|nr:hypothetical protein CDV36_016101 [Fusarium kuroshium]RSL87671.1 hypothetical protein CDV31_016213 [Fusarium ambrosium]
MATSTIHRAAEAIDRSDGNLSCDDLKRIEQAANSIITTLGGQNGLTEEEALVLLFYCCNSSNPRENLAYFGSTITRERLHYSTHDCEFITEAARLVEKDLGHEAMENGNMTRDEEDIIVAALKLQPSTVSDITHHPASAAPTPSVISSTTPSMLAALDRVSGIQDILDKDKADLTPSEAAKVVSFMRSAPEKFGGRFPRPGRMPEMPGYAEISLNDMPDTLTALDSEINARLKVEADVSAFLVRNRALLWKLKMKRNLLRQGDS